MTFPAVLKAWLRRGRTILASTRGAFDITSVLVGAAVVAILVGGTAVTTFGVIPWAQDNGAQQNLSAVNTAQSVAKVRDGKFMTGDALASASYLTASGPSLAVGANADGSCWVGFSRSDAGKTFYATGDKTNPQPWSSGTNTGCVDVSQQKQLARAVGTPMPIAIGVNFGYNMNGELGNGTKAFANSTAIAINQTGPLAGKSITMVSRGSGFACAIADGAPYCWGGNNLGQLGNGTTTESLAPAPVDTTALAGKEITSLSSGNMHTCVLADGEPYCWGNDGNGQLGTDATSTTSLIPVRVGGVLAGKKVSSLDAGNRTTCAVADGAAYCWGEAGVGATGTGHLYSNVVLPTAVSTAGALAGKTVTAISAGDEFACALADAKAYCWGNSTSGQIGNNSTGSAYYPTAVDTSGALAGKSLTAITTGDRHACATADGSLYCWGSGTNGQMGNGGTANVLVPTAVAGPWGAKPVSVVSAGRSSTCAAADGAAYCWGYNQMGQVGNGTTSDALTPVAVTVNAAQAGKQVTTLATDYYATTVVYE